MQKNDIYSYVVDGKIYHVDREGNFYDEIVTTDQNASLDGLFDKIRSGIKSGFEKVKSGVQSIFNRNNDKPEEEKQTVMDKIRNGSASVAKISSNVNTLLENDYAPGLNPQQTGMVQSGADANEANKVYQNAFNQAGMSIDVNNKMLWIGGALGAAALVYYVTNNSKKGKKAAK